MNDVLQWEELSPAQRIAIKALSLRSFEAFMRIFFQLVEGQFFKKNWHHTYECRLAEKVYKGEINRGIVNVAPGSTKTEIWSIHWPAWCIAKCFEEKRPTRWLPLSYSDDLVKENAARVKSILLSEPFQHFWPMDMAKENSAKANWKFIDKNKNQHRLYGTSTNGQVTGRRGGFMQDGFTGSLIIDDPLPPKDAESGLRVDKNNKQLNRVARSRLAHDGVPIIVIQQRICSGDSTTFLMSDKTPDNYKLFRVPAIIDQEYINNLDDEMREACIKDTGFSGPRCSYWPDKEPTETLLAMEKADNFMFSAQYQQKPDDALSEGVVYKKEIELLIEENRLCNIPVEKHLQVFTFWDLGINDDMCVWLMQPHIKELRMIACYANRDQGMEHYINWLHDFADKYGIRYQKHYAPHDIGVRDLMTGQTRQDTAKTMGIKFDLVERCKSKRDSINALKEIFPRIWIDKVRCDSDVSGNTGELAKHTGYKAIKALRREWDHDSETFKDAIGPKWATNYTDALQQMGLYYKDPVKKKPKKKRGMVNSGGWMGG